MIMRSLGTNSKYRESRARGFSLLEMVAVLAITMILASITFLSLRPVMNQQHVTNAYNTTLSAMRLARDNAVSQRTSYSVTFSNAATPNTVVVAPTLLGFTGDLNTVTYQLPTDVKFDAEPTVAATPTPDGFGTGAQAIDFGYAASGNVGGATVNTIYFCPDGSAQTAICNSGNWSNNWDNGVVYIARPGEVLSSRAITLWGGTGRVRGWRLYLTGGVYQWQRQ
jgi:prepilin-type N-terminal cleavage/methylation domain-containing protein